MPSNLSLDHIAQDALTVTNIPAGLPVQRAKNASGQLYNDATTGQPVFLRPTHALIYVANQPVRWRADGVAPDSAPGMGMFVPAGTYINWTDPLGDFTALIQRAQFVRAEGSTGNGTLEISYFA